MTNTLKAGIVGWLAGIAVAALAVVAYVCLQGSNGGKGGQPTGETKPAGGTKTTAGTKAEAPTGTSIASTSSPMKPIQKKSIKTTAAIRVHSKIVKGKFTMTGRGHDKKWGIDKVANFQHSFFVVADSEILSKKTLSKGTIEVREIRTFNKVQDSLVVSDVDFRLALDTLPLETFSKMIDYAVDKWESVTGDPATGVIVKGAKDYVEKTLSTIDGISLRQLLGMGGLKLTPEVEDMLNKLAASRLTRALGGIRRISGKSYQVTYYQEKSGQPLMITFKNKDGSDVTDDEEKMVLRRINAFIDYNVVPNTECRPGSSWTIAAEDMQEVFDPFVEGRYSGDIKATRKSDADNGDWRIDLEPSTIRVIADSGTTTGTLELKQGWAVVDPKKVTISEMFVAGKANLSKLSRHHWLFTARIDGLCDFQGRVFTENKE